MGTKRVVIGLIVLALVPLVDVFDTFALSLDFEGFPDGTLLTTQITGIAFTNATVLTAGITLNEFESPPRSGSNVVIDDGGPMTLSFTSVVQEVGGFFNYQQPITFAAFDASNALVGTEQSDFISNLVISGVPGSAPNEFLGLTFPGGIARVTIAGNPLGESFTLDDLISTQIPEPSTALLLGSGLAVLLAISAYLKSTRLFAHTFISLISCIRWCSR